MDTLQTQVSFNTGTEPGDVEFFNGLLPIELLNESMDDRDCDFSTLYITSGDTDYEMFEKIAGLYDIPVGIMGMIVCYDYEIYKERYQKICPILERLSMVD